MSRFFANYLGFRFIYIYEGGSTDSELFDNHVKGEGIKNWYDTILPYMSVGHSATALVPWNGRYSSSNLRHQNTRIDPL